MNAIVYIDNKSNFNVLKYIDDSTIEQFLKAISDLDGYEKFDLSWKMCLMNASELSDYCIHLQTIIPKQEILSSSEISLIKYQFGRQIENFVCSYYNFLEFSKSNIKKQLGKSEYELSKTIISNYYDNGFPYNFLAKFRNYITHQGLPIHLTINNNSDLKSLHFVLLTEVLLKEYDSWGKNLKLLLEKTNEESGQIDLIALFKHCKPLVSLVARDLHDLYLNKINDSVELVRSNLGDFRSFDYQIFIYRYESSVLLEEFEGKIPLSIKMREIPTTIFK